ncbi:hypothetical protein KY359_05210 [Candidatus Woesearchaeota archaeon]|nr:hypothetical protein [Candidatus Woesearchaeota archaeon]
MAGLIYDPRRQDNRPMDVVAFGSGSCTTIEAIIEHQKLCERIYKVPIFRIAALVTDNGKSKAHRIAAREKIPLVHNDFEGFMREYGLDPSRKEHRKDVKMRIQFDERTMDLLRRASESNGFRTDLVALAGYMLKLHSPMINGFAGRMINSHPANLSICDSEGRRRYRGDNAVYDAIAAGETETYTSIHVVRGKVDAGEILVMSAPLKVDQAGMNLVSKVVRSADEFVRAGVLIGHYREAGIPDDRHDLTTAGFKRVLLQTLVADPHQELQKRVCDYPAYSFALEEIAKGNFALEESGTGICAVVYKGEKMPYEGVQL